MGDYGIGWVRIFQNAWGKYYILPYKKGLRLAWERTWNDNLLREGLTMQVEKVLPCVCVDHEPDVGDSVYHGMPQLKVAGYNGRPYYEAYCPNCGRGGMFQYKTAYQALKAWNELIEEIKRVEEKGIFT